MWPSVLLVQSVQIPAPPQAVFAVPGWQVPLLADEQQPDGHARPGANRRGGPEHECRHVAVDDQEQAEDDGAVHLAKVATPRAADTGSRVPD